MLRLVFDTDVVLAAMLSASGASRKLLMHAVEGKVIGLVSVPLMLEYESVLKRPVHMKAAAASIEDVDIILDRLADISRHIDIHYSWRPFLRDADDDMVLETAINGQADAIATFNIRHFVGAETGFGIETLNPGEILRRQKWT